MKSQHDPEFDAASVEYRLGGSERVTPEQYRAIELLIGRERATHLAGLGGVVVVKSAPSAHHLVLSFQASVLQNIDHRRQRFLRMLEQVPNCDDHVAVDSFLAGKLLEGPEEYELACQTMSKKDLLASAQRFGSTRKHARNCKDAADILRRQIQALPAH